MPRPPKDLSQPAPYVPGPPPVAASTQEEVVRATWDEFQRLAAYLADPVTLAPTRLELRGGPDADQPD